MTEAADLTHPTSGLMKPGEELAEVLSEDEKLGVRKIVFIGENPEKNRDQSLTDMGHRK